MARVYIFSSEGIPSLVIYEYGIKEVCIFSPVGKLTDNIFFIISVSEAEGVSKDQL